MIILYPLFDFPLQASAVLSVVVIALMKFAPVLSVEVVAFNVVCCSVFPYPLQPSFNNCSSENYYYFAPGYGRCLASLVASSFAVSPPPEYTYSLSLLTASRFEAWTLLMRLSIF